MLNLTRRVGETLFIGDHIKIHIQEIHRQQVRLAIDAPKDIPIHREEIYQKIQRELSETKKD